MNKFVMAASAAAMFSVSMHAGAQSCFMDSYLYSGSLTALSNTGDVVSVDSGLSGTVNYDSCTGAGSFVLDSTVTMAGVEFSFSSLGLNANVDGSVRMSGTVRQLDSNGDPYLAPFDFSYDFAADVLQDDAFGVELDIIALDGDGDGILGNQVTSGAWTGLSGIFEGTFSNLGNNGNNFPAYSPVPVPAAAWLFVTGLVGLLGMARRKTS